MNEVEQIKAKLDIADIIGSYIELKPAGRNFKALSPFKQERTPSFMVSPEKRIWHDFSSGEGGDIFSFVMKMEGIGFAEALEMLARKAGVELTRTQRGSSAASRQKLYDAVKAAADFYHLSLSKNSHALDYLKKDRHLKAETIKEFYLGYGPDSRSGAAQYLLKRGFDLPTLKKAGLISQRSSDKDLIDIFRGRIVFPIYDSQGRMVGFSARILDPTASRAKYINTAATPIYNKSLAIYGLKQAKEAIRDSAEALIVEGNMDVIGLHQAGVKNAVAVSGTALTSEQLKSLSYLAETILICFDNDIAGEAAAKRAIELAASNGLNLKVIKLEGDKDPDELASHDIAKFRSFYKQAVYGLDYLIDQATRKFDMNSGRGKKQFSDYVLPVLKQINDSVEQDHYVKKIASLLDVNEVSIREKISQNRAQSSTSPVDSAPPPEQKAKLTHLQLLEQSLLELSLAFPLTRLALEDLIIKAVSPTHRRIFELLIKNDKVSTDELTKLLPEYSNYVKVLVLRGEENYKALSDHDRRMEAFAQVHHLRNEQLKIARAKLSRQLAEAERSGDRQVRDELLARFQRFLNEDL